MKVLPTLNLQNGRLVPAFHDGLIEDMEPMAGLAQLLDRGCSRFVLIDVDAAKGLGNHRDLLAVMMRFIRQANPKVCIQVGGGIRSSDQAQFFVDHGATWLMVGTILHRSPMVIDQLLGRFREHLTAAIDIKSGALQASGWSRPESLSLKEMAQKIRSRGFKRLLFNDIPTQVDSEPDFGTTQEVCETVPLPIFMGGNFRTLAQIRRAEEIRGLQGVLLDALVLLNTLELSQTLNPTCA